MTRPSPSRHSALLASGLLLLLLAVPLVVTWRAWRQEQLNHNLIMAVKQRNAQEVVDWLHAGANANARETSGQARTMWQMFSQILTRREMPSEAGRSALLLASNANLLFVSTSSEDDDPPIPDTHHSLPENALIVQALVESGAAISAQDAEGRTPLMYAVRSAYEDTVRILLQHGANAKARDKAGMKLMFYAGYGEGLCTHSRPCSQHMTRIEAMLTKAGATE